MTTYNAVTWLLDRNVEEGRGNKLAYTDGTSELSYGDLQKQSCRAANMLRRLGVRREERVAMIMLDTVDFPVVFLGAIRAGIVPVPLNTLLTADQYAYILADCRARDAVRLRSAVSGREGHRRAHERSRLRRRVRQERVRPQAAVGRAQGRERQLQDRRDPRRRAGVLALFVGLDRHAQGRAAPACQSAGHCGHLRETGARHSRG